VNAHKFLPGDIIHFKRGSNWTGGLVINDSGIEGKPIIFTAYGSGDKPVFRNPANPGNYADTIKIDADWVIVEELLISDTSYAGIEIFHRNHIVVQNNEITNVGMGMVIHGQSNLVTQNYIHDLHMYNNTPGGKDDYGAVGVLLNSTSNNEISYNKFENCNAPSYDFGSDGGVVEWWGDSNNNYIHHNFATENNGFLEVGGGQAWDNIVSYNISMNNGVFSVIHLGGTFQSDVRNFRIENNTIVETAYPDWVLIGFVGEAPSTDTFLLNNSSFMHDYNLYYLGGGTKLGYTLNHVEIIADPLFVDRVAGDFHLMPNSPAIDAGVNLGYVRDFEGNPVPPGVSPDIGAIEYRGNP
jgi:hypothetical protein